MFSWKEPFVDLLRKAAAFHPSIPRRGRFYSKGGGDWAWMRVVKSLSSAGPSSEGEVVGATIRKGIKGEMPSFSKKYGDREVAALVAYLRTLR